MTKKKTKSQTSGRDAQRQTPATTPPPVASEREFEQTKGAKAGGAPSTENSSRQVRSGRNHADNDDLRAGQRHAVETPRRS